MQAEINVAEGKKQVQILKLFWETIFDTIFTLLEISHLFPLVPNSFQFYPKKICRPKSLSTGPKLLVVSLKTHDLFHQAQILEAEAGKQGVILAAQVCQRHGHGHGLIDDQGEAQAVVAAGEARARLTTIPHNSHPRIAFEYSDQLDQTRWRRCYHHSENFISIVVM